MKEESTSHGVHDVTTDQTQIAQSHEEFVPRSIARASLIVLSGGEIGREIDVTRGPIVLGRSTHADAVINATSVSRKHARIDLLVEHGKEYFTITDIGSSNGTLVNGAPASGTFLRDGDKIRMGDVVFKFVLQDELDAHFHHEVHRLIHFDQLTGLLTMEAFRRRFDMLLRRNTQRRPFTLAMTDLDGLKTVNDTYGHLAGRMVVREMGAMIRQCLRKQDLGGLYGGDETILLFPDLPMNDALPIAEAIRETIAARAFEHQGHAFKVTISQGLAEFPAHGETVEKLIAAADHALYDAKRAGRNCVCCAEPSETPQA